MAEKEFTYKLTYFDLRGRAELIRFILHYAQVPFEDHRLPPADWLKFKNDLPKKSVPILEVTTVADGEKWILTESLTIARFLARRYNLTGKNEAESAQCDEVVDNLIECWYASGYAYYEKEEQRRAELIKKFEQDDMPRLLGYLEKKIVANGGEHIVGKQITWADLAVSVVLFHFKYFAKQSVGLIEPLCPTLSKLAKSIEQIPSIAEWIAKRPDTDR